MDIYVNEPAQVNRDLFALWAKEFAKLGNFNPNPKRSFNLDTFQNGQHNIVIPPDSRILNLAVHKVRFSPAHNPKTTYTIEADISEDRLALSKELERKRLGIAYIKQVGIEAVMQAEEAGQTIRKRFDLSGKSCSLRHEDEAGEIRALLKSAGIDETL